MNDKLRVNQARIKQHLIKQLMMDGCDMSRKSTALILDNYLGYALTVGYEAGMAEWGPEMIQENDHRLQEEAHIREISKKAEDGATEVGGLESGYAMKPNIMELFQDAPGSNPIPTANLHEQATRLGMPPLK